MSTKQRKYEKAAFLSVSFGGSLWLLLRIMARYIGAYVFYQTLIGVSFAIVGAAIFFGLRWPIDNMGEDSNIEDEACDSDRAHIKRLGCVLVCAIGAILFVEFLHFFYCGVKVIEHCCGFRLIPEMSMHVIDPAHVNGRVIEMESLTTLIPNSGLLRGDRLMGMGCLAGLSFQRFGHQGEVTSLSIDRGRPARLVSSSYDRTAKVFDIESRTALAILRGHRGIVLMTEFSQDGDRILTVDDSEAFALWDGRSYEMIASIPCKGITYAAIDSVNKRITACTAEGGVEIWDYSDEQHIRPAQARNDVHAAQIRTICFSPDLKHLITASFDGTAKVITANTLELVASLDHAGDPVFFASYNPSGKVIATASNQNVRFWNAETFELNDNPALRGMPSNVMSVSFSPDGERMASCHVDGTAHVWDTQNLNHVYECLPPLNLHENVVSSAAFTSDGRLFTASYDGRILSWSLEFRDPI